MPTASTSTRGVTFYKIVFYYSFFTLPLTVCYSLLPLFLHFALSSEESSFEWVSLDVFLHTMLCCWGLISSWIYGAVSWYFSLLNCFTLWNVLGIVCVVAVVVFDDDVCQGLIRWQCVAWEYSISSTIFCCACSSSFIGRALCNYQRFLILLDMVFCRIEAPF